MKAREVNFDGLPGLTHHYAGLSFGNEASTKHRYRVSNPQLAAKQGLKKMKALADAGYPQALIRLRNWDYYSLDAIIRGEVDIGFCGRETHPRSREQLSLLPWYIDFEILFTDLPQVWLRADHPALNEEWDLDTFLRYPHINICWEQSDTWALDDVLHDLGHKRTVALTVPGFEQSLFMAAQPHHTMLATAPRYCQRYNQQHHLPLVSLPLPLEPSQLEKIRVPFTLLWHKRNSYNPKIVWLRETLRQLYVEPL